MNHTNNNSAIFHRFRNCRAGRSLLLITCASLAIIFLFACSQQERESSVQSKHRTKPNWTAYDGMLPQRPEGGQYFAASFMPVMESGDEDSLKIAGDGEAIPIYYSSEDATVVRIAAEALRNDIEQVTGLAPVVTTLKPQSTSAILIGTVGDSPLIDALVAAGKIDITEIQGKWEAYTAAVIDAPLPDVNRALVIAGSDRRGTAYGVFALSESMGVSPWHFWGDVPSQKHSSVYVAGSHTQPSPGVKYRGIFINDEDWGFQPWAAKTFEPEVGNIGPKTYATVFELLLRLHANMIWPAMHEFPIESTPFYLHPENKVVADNYAIVVSTSHHEPMLRNSHEYKPEEQGPYDYWANRDVLYKFWEERVIETADYENIYTMGMRGRDDSGMKAPEGTTNKDKAAKIQHSIIPDQRKMIQDHVNADPSEIPQIFIPYKETLVQYQSGLQLEDDITIVWPDDNHGYIRQLSTNEEKKRSGGTGVYYHLQYWGVPKSYLWLHTTPLGMTRSEMMKAWDFDSRKIWIVNVGDIKPYELGTEFFLRLARNPEAFREFNQHSYLTQWAARTFGEKHAQAIATVMTDYFRLNIVKRPEHIDRNKSTFSLIQNGDEAQQRQTDFAALKSAADAIYAMLDDTKKAAFYEMILYPVRASNYANQRVLLAERSRLWAEQGRAASNAIAANAEAQQQALIDETRFYNEKNADGKWNHMISQMPTSLLPSWAHETQNPWAMPEVGQYHAPDKAELGVVLEGSAQPLETKISAALPLFNRAADSHYFIDVFNKGKNDFHWTAKTNIPWIKLSETYGTKDTRIIISIDWSNAPQGETISGSIMITGTGAEYAVAIQAYNPTGLDLTSLPKAVENNKKVVFEAEDFHARSDLADGTGWRIINAAAASRDGVTVLPVTSLSKDPAALELNSPAISYEFFAFTTGPVEISTQTLPTHRITSDHLGARYAISLNGDAPQIVDINAIEYSDTWNMNTLRAMATGLSRHEITEPGVQTLNVWMIDAGVVLDRFSITLNK